MFPLVPKLEVKSEQPTSGATGGLVVGDVVFLLFLLLVVVVGVCSCGDMILFCFVLLKELREERR
jgi:hypothetical protein